jgi:lipid A ethanolaminephosphotransferase
MLRAFRQRFATEIPISFTLTTRPAANIAVFTFAISLLLVFAYNARFWQAFFQATGGFSLVNLTLYLGTSLILILSFNAALTLFAFRLVLKPLIALLLWISALVAYFMDKYGVMIDATMIQNIVESDVREAEELLTPKLIIHLLFLGVLPALGIWRLRLHYPPVGRALLSRSCTITISAAIVAGLLLAFFKTYAPTYRENRELRFLLTPTNSIQAINSYLKHRTKSFEVAPVGRDAVKGELWKGHSRRLVTVIVVGETARAENFSLDGYSRETNPLLSNEPDLINFPNAYSCGTSTAVSVPCVFSALGRAAYSDSRAKRQEGLLDVLSHAGFHVLWRDNNSGCKGTCDRVEFQNVSKTIASSFCTSEQCYDEHLLEGVPLLIKASETDLVFVLHQSGSHGPAYWKRYPPEFARFQPVCRTNDFKKCSRESVISAYDNTILYTDYFLSRTIALLRSGENEFDASLFYFSDHGESLGENNLYLHGLPYVFSPKEQRHVPFMIWFSKGFRQRFRIDTECLSARAEDLVSHDNVFHSILGMLNVRTEVYKPSLDIFHGCRIGDPKIVG